MTEEVAYDPRVNYWESNPHLRFLIERELGSNASWSEINFFLQTAGEVSGKEIAPKTYKNDETGCTLEECVSGTDSLSKQNLKVVLPEGTTEALKKLREIGIFGMSLPERYDGGGLPEIVSGAVAYMMFQADAAMYTIPGLTDGVAETILHFGSEGLRQKYVPRLCSTKFDEAYTGAMLLTESQAGSDIGAVKTSAKKKDSHYALNGEKIFISNPDADVLVVLARVEGAQGGTKGLSLFLVPKHLDDGKRNSVYITRLEKKVGINSSPTGTVLFDDAISYLIGEESKGFGYMLYLMNRSRVGVGTQGLGIAERAFLQSITYCAERVQFKQRLEELPLMQEHLVNMRIEIEAGTSLVFKAYDFLDKYLRLQVKFRANPQLSSEEQEQFDKYQSLVRILTTLAKYRGSEIGRAIAQRAIDNFGGSGYITETGVEQRLREAIITGIYEGTNDIQALDVLKSISKGNLEALLRDATENLNQVRNDILRPYADKVAKAIEYAQAVMAKILSAENPLIVAQVEARKVTEFLITTYEASLMLEESQHLIDSRRDWRKSVMAMKYIDDKMSPFGEDINPNMTAAKYFDGVVKHTPLSSLN